MSTAGTSRISIRDCRTAFVVNPMSGRAGTRARRIERVQAFIARHQLDAQVFISERAGHAHDLARAAAESGHGVIVSVGGDGTMNQVASAVVDRPIGFGIVPCGSGNGLARDLGVPLGFDRALALLLDARIRPIDTGAVNGLPFFNVAGFGLDAEISERFNRCKERGLASYFRLGFGALFSTPVETLEVVSDAGEAESLPSFMTALANSTQYGNNARIAPRARLDDGKLDLVVIRSRNPVVAFWLGLRAFAGNLDRASAVRTIQARAFTIRRPRAGPIHTDGEVFACPATLEVRVVPQSLRVLVPRDAWKA